MIINLILRKKFPFYIIEFNFLFMKNDKCLKKEFYKFLNNIKRISEFLDYKTINQFLITSREISQVAQDLRLNYTLDLRHSTFNS